MFHDKKEQIFSQPSTRENTPEKNVNNTNIDGEGEMVVDTSSTSTVDVENNIQDQKNKEPKKDNSAWTIYLAFGLMG